MNSTKEALKNIIKDNIDKPVLYQRNLLKEYLQIFVLDYIYSNKKYNNLIFYGGSCLAQLYLLPRLSEDMDFVDINGRVDIKKLANDIANYFKAKTDLCLEIKVQKFRIYLKFPILKELNLTTGTETDYLFLKIEIFKHFDFCTDYKIEIRPLFKNNKSLLIKTFDLSTLMSTKIRAVLNRRWEKTDKQGKILASVKGRDYFDLMWYLDRGVKPNLKCLNGYKTIKDIKNDLLRAVNKADSKSIVYDLENFVSDKEFVKNLSKNIKNILINGVNDL